MTFMGLFGLSDSFLGFAHFLVYLMNSTFEVMFLVLVLNMAFSALKYIVLRLGGVKK